MVLSGSQGKQKSDSKRRIKSKKITELVTGLMRPYAHGHTLIRKSKKNWWLILKQLSCFKKRFVVFGFVFSSSATSSLDS